MSKSTGPPATWSAILADAVTKPGVISEAYRTFWNYSIGNQFLALFECHCRGIPPGPINTYLGWQKLGRQVKKGEKALTLCMPVSVKMKSNRKEDEPDREKQTLTRFIFRPHWFVLSQTDGEEYIAEELPGWDEARALTALGINRVLFDAVNGNTQGYAQGVSVAVSPIAFQAQRTLFHELAHVVLGHTAEVAARDDERTPRGTREVEAESVALICMECLGVAGAEFSRGYIQHYLRSDPISERSAQKIFKAADRILRAGRPEETEEKP